MVISKIKVSHLKGFRIARPRRNGYTNIAGNYSEELFSIGEYSEKLFWGTILHWRVKLYGVNLGALERYASRRVKTISTEYSLEIILSVIEGGITERN